MKIVCRLLLPFFFAPNSPLQDSSTASGDNVKNWQATTKTFLCEEDTRDRHDEAAHAEDANLARTKYLKVSRYIVDEPLNVDLYHIDAAAIDYLADKLDGLSVFLFPSGSESNEEVVSASAGSCAVTCTLPCHAPHVASLCTPQQRRMRASWKRKMRVSCNLHVCGHIVSATTRTARSRWRRMKARCACNSHDMNNVRQGPTKAMHSHQCEDRTGHRLQDILLGQGYSNVACVRRVPRVVEVWGSSRRWKCPRCIVRRACHTCLQTHCNRRTFT